MRKCKCGRELRLGEKQCPACAANADHSRKKAVGIGTMVLAAGAFVWKAGVAVYKAIKSV